jgi:hypothetical protein
MTLPKNTQDENRGARALAQPAIQDRGAQLVISFGKPIAAVAADRPTA